ncbi:hypothetical protein PYJP_12310 [Pyrofollis japonicus]|uniref:hypothetical protein n=1 Tax=Pyrofollis japonicus TaxID=3060460 RepID=UPI00295B66DE|nr:hypothetical protein [Pyrofollis japonicus]BEP17879.1 hypothetical protein PYJP_12310 [Pyrofollis japonicus]
MKNMRAISPVVATALLVLIAVAVLLYTWVAGTVSNQPTSSATLQESILIDHISYDSHNNKLTIYVRNIGNMPVNLSAVYVINATNGSIIATNVSKSLFKVQVPPANVTKVVVNLGDTKLVPGSTILVKVVTREGVTATYVTTIRG